MTDFKFIEKDHTYWLDGVRLPSVSEIIKPLVDFSGIPKKVLDNKCELGIKFHKIAALHLRNNLNIETVDEQLKKPFEAFQQWEEAVGLKRSDIICIERQMYHDTLGYAGTVDLIAIINGVRTIIDWKLRTYNAISDPLQLSGYYGLYENCAGYSVTKSLMVVSFDLKGNYRQTDAHNDQAYPVFRKLLEHRKTEIKINEQLERWKEHAGK